MYIRNVRHVDYVIDPSLYLHFSRVPHVSVDTS